MNQLQLVLALLSQAESLTPVFVTLIGQLRNQGTDVDAILAANKSRFEANEFRILENLAKLSVK